MRRAQVSTMNMTTSNANRDGKRCVNCGTKLQQFERDRKMRMMRIFNKKYCAQCTALGVFIEETANAKEAALDVVHETRQLPTNIIAAVKGIIARTR